ncbi:transcription termination factor Rho [Nocardioides jiangxiensis]|uniref:Transcription termination factor Rho n=1 Tax=Nocardioides jiangxiensis TaxID=3064524 RepID=A0ABT9B228_9ACTN|nr:transcription termination factor Rho [Nocardioides sp. WY-20]MDO7867331.1 transcription termination factor Rho [Nocardioides sp. WY-20]
MTEAPEATPARKTKKPAGLNGMLIADLKAMANALAIPGANSMKKADLVAAIQGAGTPKGETSAPARQRAPRAEAPAAQDEQAPQGDQPADRAGSEGEQAEQAPSRNRRNRNRNRNAEEQAESAAHDGEAAEEKTTDQPEQGGRQQNQQGNQRQQGNQQARQQSPQQGQGNQGNQQGQQGQQGNQNQQGEDGDGTGNRRRRGRDRDRSARGRNEPDTTILEDDVLVPAAGILDVLDNYAFVRTSGYLPGPDDVYVSLSLVRKLGLRRGDAIVGQVRQPREGERKEKFNPMVRIDSVNGVDPETAKDRVVFEKLTPLHPTERLQVATDGGSPLGKAIDTAAPVGKGQRGLIVSPPKAGKTTVLQTMSSALTTNNPECHLMVVLIDERPEEVTDFQRSVKGEVIASTFDRPASDHTIVAELAIERAKRLVELGHDVVVLLDGITRLGRAYNLAIPPSGRLLSGGVDAAALYPPKKFFGAARNIENGGSLTILATALVESGSKTDEVILEEFAGTANMELRLRQAGEGEAFPAVDVAASGTRHRELLQPL